MLKIEGKNICFLPRNDNSIFLFCKDDDEIIFVREMCLFDVDIELELLWDIRCPVIPKPHI